MCVEIEKKSYKREVNKAICGRKFSVFKLCVTLVTNVFS